jgi:hypothetical protein
MYHYWKPVAEVVRGVPFHKRAWRPVAVASFVYRENGRKPYYAGRFFEGWPRNFSYRIAPDSRPTAFRITPEGQVDHPESFNAVLTGSQSHTLTVQVPVDTALVVHVPEISLQGTSGNPLLLVKVDGREALKQTLEAKDRQHVWEFWDHYSVALAAGQRSIEVSNAGGGALWTAYELKQYLRREGPDLDVFGMQTDDYILLWVRNPAFNWIYDREGRQPEEQAEGLLTLDHAAPGIYSATWWETTTGEVLARRVATAANGRLALATPKITRSAAAKLVRVDTP